VRIAVACSAMIPAAHQQLGGLQCAVCASIVFARQHGITTVPLHKGYYA
jgi:hypothetical protein